MSQDVDPTTVSDVARIRAELEADRYFRNKHV